MQESSWHATGVQNAKIFCSSHPPSSGLLEILATSTTIPRLEYWDMTPRVYGPGLRSSWAALPHTIEDQDQDQDQNEFSFQACQLLTDLHQSGVTDLHIWLAWFNFSTCVCLLASRTCA